MIHPVLHIIKNYPLQYIYFNEISGGVNKVYKKYETDYYMHSLKPGSDWIISNIISKEKAEGKPKIKILSNAPFEIMNYYFREYRDFVEIPYARYYDRGMYDWDYAIFFCNYIDPFQLKKNIWPPKNTIHMIKVDDVTVCAIVKRENRDDYLGYNMMNKASGERDIAMMSESIRLMRNAISYDPFNEVTYLNLAQAYLLIEQFDLARINLNSLLEIYPEYDKALNLIGYSFLSEGDIKRDKLLIDKSIAYFNHVIQVNYKFTQAYHNNGLAFMILGDDETALAWFNKALDINARYKQSYFMIANILEKRGDQQRADQLRQYANSI
jgi:tetratricopeptide (TPR) repeat protein